MTLIKFYDPIKFDLIKFDPVKFYDCFAYLQCDNEFNDR